MRHRCRQVYLTRQQESLYERGCHCQRGPDAHWQLWRARKIIHAYQNIQREDVGVLGHRRMERMSRAPFMSREER